MRYARLRGWTACWTACLAGCVLLGLGTGTVQAQEAPVDVTDRVGAIVQALDRLAVEADRGAWQAADAAFNDVLDALDVHQPDIEAMLGAPAVEAFAELRGLVDELVDALDAEDAARVRAVVVIAAAGLRPLAPGLPGPAAADEVQAVLEWRSAVETILALGDAGAWRDMRNSAMDLTADVERRGPRVASAAGPDAAGHVDALRVFAMRLRAAALEQSMPDARMASDFAAEALDALGRRLGSLPEPTGTPRPQAGVRPRAYIVEAEPGEIVVVPIVLEDVPQIGLGSVDLYAQWSPRGLRLLDVSWDVGNGAIVRDDARGLVELSLPRAPVGPAGDVVLARLRFEVVGGGTDSRDYLPAEEVGQIETAAAEARAVAAQGDTPRAASMLADAYGMLLAGRGREDSLYGLLSRHGLAEPLARRLLFALDLTSQPAETDRIVVALRELDEVLAAAWSSHLAAIGGTDGLPIRLFVREIADTTGEPLPALEPIDGLVRLPAWALQPATNRTAAPTAAIEATRLPTAAIDGTPEPSVSPVRTPTASAPGSEGPSFPVALVVVLVLAGVAGVSAVLLADRRSRDTPEPG